MDTPKSSVPDERTYRIRILGVNGSLTQELGAAEGVVATRTGEGAYRLTWSHDPGTFVGWAPGLGAATPGDLAGYTAIRDTYASKVLDFVVYSDTPAAADLIAAQYIDIAVTFSLNPNIG